MLTAKELDDFTREFEGAEEEGAAESTQAPKKDTNGEKIEQQRPEPLDKQEQNPSDGLAIWNGLSDDQRGEVQSLQSQLAKAQHAADSDKGRHQALKAKIDKLEQVATEADKGKKVEDGISDQELSDLKQELPEVSAMVSRETSDLKQQLTKLEQRLTEAQTSIDATAYVQTNQQNNNAELQKVMQAHPDFHEIKGDINYATWLGRQSSGVQALADSNSADDAIALIGLFKDKRKRKPKVDLNHELDSMAALPNKGAAKATHIEEDDFDAHFEHFGKLLSK